MSLDLDALLPEIQAGDTESFGRFMVASELPVRRSLRPFAARVDVEAVVQETFLRLWQVAPRFEPDGRPNGLFRLGVRVARNLALDALKKRREQVGVDLEDAAAFAPAEADPLLRSVIQTCLEKLPQQPGVALRARLESAGAEPDSEIAGRCAMKANTFLQNVTRARKLLASCLEAAGVVLSEAVGG
jgi:RNA polymerase sigma factor (sigma-70 family)